MLTPRIAPAAGTSTTGAAGAVVSTLKVLVFDTGETLPAASVARAFTVWLPCVSACAAVSV